MGSIEEIHMERGPLTVSREPTVSELFDIVQDMRIIVVGHVFCSTMMRYTGGGLDKDSDSEPGSRKQEKTKAREERVPEGARSPDPSEAAHMMSLPDEVGPGPQSGSP